MSRLQSAIRFLFLLLIVSQCLPSVAAADLARQLASLENVLEAKRQELGVPGMALAVVQGDKVLYLKGFGLRDVERKLPVTPTTLFPIASNTKGFTGMLAVMSEDDGVLSLEDSPKKFLPYFKLYDPLADANVTLRDLLTHRTGLRRTDLMWITRVLNRSDALRALAYAKPTYAFRRGWAYNNTTFSAAGEAVAAAQNTTYEELVHRRIFVPLGMHDSLTSISEMRGTPDFSYGYDISPTKTVVQQPEISSNFSNIVSAGSIQSNITDMTRWLRLLINGGVFEGKRLISDKSYQTLIAPLVKAGANSSYGLGWNIIDWNGHKVIQHGGSAGSGGYRSRVAFMPDQKLGFVFLTNTSLAPMVDTAVQEVWANLIGGKRQNTASPDDEDSDADEVGQDTLAAGQAVTADATTPLPPQQQELIGTYESDNGRSIEMLASNGKLTANYPDGQVYILAELARDTFSLLRLSTGQSIGDKFKFEFRRSKEGAVESVYLYQPQSNILYRKVKEFTAPISVEALMAKAIEAAGGEENLKRHVSAIADIEIDFENQGVGAVGTIKTRYPGYRSTDFELWTLDKKIGSVHEYSTGPDGGEQTSWILPITWSKRFNEMSQMPLDLHELLNWKTLFKKVRIAGIANVSGTQAYQVIKTPAKGSATVDYISTRTFTLLKRESPIKGWISGSESYHNYRLIDGVMIPMRTVVTTKQGQVVLTLKDVRFNEAIDDSSFKVREDGAVIRNIADLEPQLSPPSDP
jgi:CubicO group peptidase (beta-lactamase class C family)